MGPRADTTVGAGTTASVSGSAGGLSMAIADWRGIVTACVSGGSCVEVICTLPRPARVIGVAAASSVAEAIRSTQRRTSAG